VVPVMLKAQDFGFPPKPDPLRGDETAEDVKAVREKINRTRPNGAAPDEPSAPAKKHWPDDWPSDWPRPDDLPEDWPKPMGQAAFHGPAGEFVRLALSQTEADPNALLLCFLVAFGSLMGRDPHCILDGARHGVNLFALLVGKTAGGRKGTASNRAVEMTRLVDSVFINKCKKSGLISGQGVTYHIRDEREDDVEIKEKGRSLGWERRVVDPGVEDKRLLVIEEEFSSVLKQFDIPGNILSPILRKAFDGTELSSMARGNKDRCKEPHMSIIAQITPEELSRDLTATEKANGLVNRFLLCCCHRYQKKPHGGNPLNQKRVDDLVAGLQKALFESKKHHLTLDTEPRDGRISAYKAWEDVYDILTDNPGGMFGEMTARASTLVMRLAMLYAKLDCSDVILLPHLEAAQEVWSYSERSVRYLFGDALGDETADAILRMLRTAPDGLTKTQINDGFGRNRKAKELDRALNVLLKHKRAACEKVTDTGGGPAEVWRAI
jgi:hypothetical protein